MNPPRGPVWPRCAHPHRISPELNPDELVWGNVKTRIAKMGVQTKDDLKAVVHGALRRLLKMPQLVASFFQ